MARPAKLVDPGIPHHVTQRGNCGEQTFFSDGDYAAYVERIKVCVPQQRLAASMQLWAPISQSG
jgi:putative transposase